MGKIYLYLLKDFFRTFVTYFMILFFLVSITYFVRISVYTAVMHMTFLDVLQTYLYNLPQIIIYSFPITYFISLVLSLYNFSKDGEMLVIFSLGESPKKIINLYFLLTFIVSIGLVLNSLIFIPLSEQASNNFIKIKKMESKINIKSSEVGQKIGDWNIFTKKSDRNIYNDLILFSSNYNKNEQFILSKSAKFNSSGDSVSLVLNNGNHFILTKDDKIIQTKFKILNLTNALTKDELDNKSIYEYWMDAKSNKTRAKWLCLYILLSFFPFLSIFLAFSLGIINSRIQKRMISFWIGAVVVVYYGFSFKISAIYPLYGGIIFVFSYFLTGFLILRKMILKRY